LHTIGSHINSVKTWTEVCLTIWVL